MSNPVCWFEIYVNDMDRAKKFYESLFNLQLTQLSDP
ncbi:MAG: VOC family protein, partial [Acinetobacter sp.]